MRHCAIYKLAETVEIEVSEVKSDYLYESHEQAEAIDPNFDEDDVWPHDCDEIWTHSFKAVD